MTTPPTPAYVQTPLGEVFQVIATYGNFYWLLSTTRDNEVLTTRSKASVTDYVPTPQIGETWTDDTGNDVVVVGLDASGNPLTVPVGAAAGATVTVTDKTKLKTPKRRTPKAGPR